MERFKFYAFKISGIIILIFILQLLLGGVGFTGWFVLNGGAFSDFEIWRFVTAIFLHGGCGHLFL